MKSQTSLTIEKYKAGSDIEYAYSSTESLLEKFSTSMQGLTSKEAKKRHEQFGLNQPARKKKRSIIFKFFSKFVNPLIIILIIIALLSLFFGEEISALMVVIMILVSVFLDFFQEFKSGREAEKLKEMVKSTATVYRDSKQKEVKIRYIVPGDIVYLSAGDMVPADLRIISCKDLFINQASLTGESYPVEKFPTPSNNSGNQKSELMNIAYMGSSVVTGTAIGMVIRVGTSTKLGELSKRLVVSPPITSFDKGIKRYTWMIIRFTIVMALVIFTINAIFKHNLIQALLFSLAVAVGLTPEMLPMLVTVNLSKGAISMSKKKVIVKRLNSIQNLGAMDILCTDKTGTLTLGEIVLEKHIDVRGNESEDVLKYAYINSFYQTGMKNLLDRAVLKHEKVLVHPYQKIDEIPFDFSRKVMSVVVEYEGRHRIITKGAPEHVFPKCIGYEMDGIVHELNSSVISNIEKEYYKLSADGFIVLAIAYNNIKTPKKAYSKDDENTLILKGYVAFLDPPKSSAKRTIKELEGLGIEVKVLTGDNELVTTKICREVGIAVNGLSTGEEIDKLNDEELRQIVTSVSVFVRLSPFQKERIVLAMKQNNHVVGYLGDGINDAPSLKISDVGISVNNAVDIAKESADIILLEKSLGVLEYGVLEGRKTFGNITKYIRMGSSSNFGNMLSITGASLFLPFLPMSPLQILLNNFLYDMSQVAIPTDNVDDEYLVKSRSWNIESIKRFMLIFGPVSSVFDFITFGVLFFVFKVPESAFHTGWFLESLITQTLVIHVIRTSKIPFIESKPSNFLILTSIFIILAGLIIPFSPLDNYLGFGTLPISYFGVLIFIVLFYLITAQIVKRWVVRKYGYN